MLKDRVKQLRKNLTPTEQALWQKLRNRQINGLKFRRQQIIEKYIVDFYCAEKRLVIEVDGDTHAMADYQAYDAERENFLEMQGLTILRFTNKDVLDNIEGVLITILSLTAK